MGFEETLDAVGPRLRALRQRHGSTLDQVAAATGISVSTLSRLEAGQRKPTLELLLPVARFHGVGLDELVEPPHTADPRVQSEPVTRHGMVFQTLSRDHQGLQAFKILLPAGPTEPAEQQSHEGWDWLYVLSGRVRLLLGERDLILTGGEAAEFDTHVPHSFANAGRRPAELLMLVGPGGERIHVRARERG